MPFFGDQGFLYYRKDPLVREHLGVPKIREQPESDAITPKSKSMV